MTYKETKDCTTFTIDIECDDCQRSQKVTEISREEATRVLVSAGWTFEIKRNKTVYRCGKCTQKWKDKQWKKR